MTFATSLIADRWTGNSLTEDRWENPSIEVVEEAIRHLDQRTHTNVTVDGNDWWFIMIGGGDGRYVVSIENQMTGKVFDLMAETRSGEEQVALVTGGQRGLFDPRLVTDLDSALRAARRFVDDGLPDPTLTWRESTRA